MAVDLMALAKVSDETFMDVETSFGELRVYHVPDVKLLSAVAGGLEPELPTVRMKTATGWQNRLAKQGDEEYEDYKQAKADYEEMGYRLRVAVGAVSALKDVDWSACDLSGPPPVKDAIEMYEGRWPDHELLQKKAWLDWTILFKRSDQNAILEAMNIMNGETEPDPDMVDEVKKNSE